MKRKPYERSAVVDIHPDVAAAFEQIEVTLPGRRERRARKIKNTDSLTVTVCTAGIGRMGFRAYLGDYDTDIDRQDGDDEGVGDTPGQALAALGARLDRELIHKNWVNGIEKRVNARGRGW